MARFCLLILLLAGAVLTPAQAAADSLQIPVCGWVDDLTANQVPEPERRMLIAGYITVTPAVFAEDQREAQWAMMEDVAREGQVLFGANIQWRASTDDYIVLVAQQNRPVTRGFTFGLNGLPITRSPTVTVALLYRSLETTEGLRTEQDFYVHRLTDGALFLDRADLKRFNNQGVWGNFGTPHLHAPIAMEFSGDWQPDGSMGALGGAAGWAGAAGCTIRVDIPSTEHAALGSQSATIVGYRNDIIHQDRWHLSYIGNATHLLDHIRLGDPAVADFDNNGAVNEADVTALYGWFQYSPTTMRTSQVGGYVVFSDPETGEHLFLPEFAEGVLLNWAKAMLIPHDYNLLPGIAQWGSTGRLFTGFNAVIGAFDVRVEYLRSEAEGTITAIAPREAMVSLADVPAWVRNQMGTIEEAEDTLTNRIDSVKDRADDLHAHRRIATIPGVHTTTGRMKATDEAKKHLRLLVEIERSETASRTDDQRALERAADVTDELPEDGFDPTRPPEDHHAQGTIDRLLDSYDPVAVMENAALEMEETLADLPDVTPHKRTDFGTWRPGDPIPGFSNKTGQAKALVDTANEMARFMEGGRSVPSGSGDYKKALIWPAGVLPRDVVPPWGGDPTMSEDEIPPGDGNNPALPMPLPIRALIGAPFYDHDGDGDLDRFWSTDPYDNGYSHLRLRWKFMPVTASVRVGMGATYRALGAELGFQSFSPTKGTGDFYKHAAFSIAGVTMRPDGIVDKEEIIFWGNDTAFKTDEKKDITSWKVVAGSALIGGALIAAGIFTFGAGTIVGVSALAGGGAIAGSGAYGAVNGTDREYYYGPTTANFFILANDGVSEEQRWQHDPERNPSGSSTWIFRLLYTGPSQPIQMEDPGDIEIVQNDPVEQTFYRTSNQPRGEFWFAGRWYQNTPIPGSSTQTDPTAQDVIRDHEGTPVIDHIIYERSQTFVNAQVDQTTLAAAGGAMYSVEGFTPLTTPDTPEFMTLYQRETELWFNGAPPVDRAQAIRDGNFQRLEVSFPGYLFFNTGFHDRPDDTKEYGYGFLLETINFDTHASDGTPLYDERGTPLIDLDENGEPDNADNVVDTRNGRYIELGTGLVVTDFTPYCIDLNADGEINQTDYDLAEAGVHPTMPMTFVIFREQYDPERDEDVAVRIRTIRYERDPDLMAEGLVAETIDPPEANMDAWGWGVHDLIPRGTPEFVEGDSLAKNMMADEDLESIYEIMNDELTNIHRTLQRQVVESLEIAGGVMTAGAIVSTASTALASTLTIISMSSTLSSGLLSSGVGSAVVALEGGSAATATGTVGGAGSSAGSFAASAGLSATFLAAGAMVTYITVMAHTTMDENPISQGNRDRAAWFQTVREGQHWRNGGSVILNGEAVYSDDDLAAFLGIDGSVPMITNLSASLKTDTGGLIEFVVHDDPTLVRPDQQGTPLYWMGQATHYRAYDRNRYPAHMDFNFAMGADILPSPYGHRTRDVNFTGDRLYRVDSGFGWYMHMGRIMRFFNEVQQTIILRYKWAYEFMTPPSRMIRQYWNNNDPNTPLLNQVRPRRADARLTQMGAETSTPTGLDLDKLDDLGRAGEDLTIAEALEPDIVAMIENTNRTQYTFRTRNHQLSADNPARDWSPESQALPANRVVERRSFLQKNGYYLFSAMRGREWEQEMAKRMPSHITLVCVEWEDRELTREQFARFGREVTFAEHPHQRTPEGVLATGRDELAVYNEIAQRFFGVSPAPLVKFGDHMARFDRNSESIIGQIVDTVQGAFEEEVDTGLTPGSKTDDSFVQHMKRFRHFPYITPMPDGKPAVWVDRKDDDVVYQTRGDAQTYRVDWSQHNGGDQDGRIFYLLFPGEDDPTTNERLVDLAPSTNTMARRADLVEFRHPMLLYYHDETSAIYVHYGTNCNPKATFGRWDEHVTGAGVDDTDPEWLRRTAFENNVASNRCALENIYAELDHEGYQAYLASLQQRDPPPPVADPGPEPTLLAEPVYDGPEMPTRPIEPERPVQPFCRLPTLMDNRADRGFGGASVDGRWQDYNSRFEFVAEGPGYAFGGNTAGETTYAVLYAADGYGHRFDVEPGDIVEIQYVSGIWSFENRHMESPDNFRRWNGNGHGNGAILTDARGLGDAGRLHHIPHGTSVTPFTYTVAAGITTLALKINDGQDGGNYNDNYGNTLWRVTVKRSVDATAARAAVDLIKEMNDLRSETTNPYLPLTPEDMVIKADRITAIKAELTANGGATCWEYAIDYTNAMAATLDNGRAFTGPQYYGGTTATCAFWRPRTSGVLQRTDDILDGIVIKNPYRDPLNWLTYTGFQRATPPMGRECSFAQPWGGNGRARPGTMFYQWDPLTRQYNSWYVKQYWAPPADDGPSFWQLRCLLEPVEVDAGPVGLRDDPLLMFRDSPGKITPDDVDAVGIPFVKVRIHRPTRVFLDYKGRGIHAFYDKPDGQRWHLTLGHNGILASQVDAVGRLREMTPYEETRLVIDCEEPGEYIFYAEPIRLVYTWLDDCSDGGGDHHHTFWGDCFYSEPVKHHYEDHSSFLTLMRVQQEPAHQHCLDAWLAYESRYRAYSTWATRDLPGYDREHERWSLAVDDYVRRQGEVNQQNGTYAVRHAQWEQDNIAYQAYREAFGAWDEIQRRARDYLRARDIWIRSITTEAGLAGVEWSSAGMTPVGLEVTLPQDMPSTPIWQAYKYLIIHPDPDGTIALELVTGIPSDERRRKLTAPELITCR